MTQKALEKLLALEAEQTIPLLPMQGWSEGRYRIDEQHVGAIQAAYLANRPLLVRGDPGLGKSQLAQAIASHLDWGLVSAVIHYNSVIDDLLYSVDHLERLHMANRGGDDATLDIQKYVRPGKVWQAMAPDTVAKFQGQRPHDKAGTVLLIDEIDKADSSLPNALLEVLDKRAISCPHLSQPIQQLNHPVFTVITSNDERLLPMAFIRRCAILNLHLESGDAGVERLRKIYQTHVQFKPELKLPDDTVSMIGKWIVDKRDNSEPREYKPGTSEFLDVIRALSAFPEDKRAASFDFLYKSLIDKRQQRAQHEQ